MGVDTKAFIPDVGFEIADKIIYILKNKFNAQVSDLKKSGVDDDYKTINFSFENNEGRNLHLFLYSDKNKKHKNKFRVGNKSFYGLKLDFGAWGSAVQIMTAILKWFDGYLDKNDCDSEGYRKVKKADNWYHWAIEDIFIGKNEE
jgi:hypothetical protein